MPSTYPTALDNLTTGHADGTGEIVHAATPNDLASSVNAMQLDGRQGPVFNVMHYGATGRNVADDTIAIQAAITAAGTASAQSLNGRGIVLVPPGDYKVTSQLAVNSDNVTIRGSGPLDSSRFIVPVGGSDLASVIRFGVTRTVTAPCLENITLVCNGTSVAGGTHTTGHGVIFDCNTPQMHYVRVMNAPQDGVQWICTGTGVGAPTASFEGFAIDCTINRPGRDGWFIDSTHFNEELIRCLIHGAGYDTSPPYGRYGFWVQGGAIKFIACHPYHMGFNLPGLVTRTGTTTTVCNLPVTYAPNPGCLVNMFLTYTSGPAIGLTKTITANTTTTVTTTAFGATPTAGGGDTFTLNGGAALQCDSTQDIDIVSGEYESSYVGVSIGPGVRFKIDGGNFYANFANDILCTNTQNGGRILNNTCVSVVGAQIYLNGNAPGCEDMQITGNYCNFGIGSGIRVDNGIRGVIANNAVAMDTTATRSILLNSTTGYVVNGNVIAGNGVIAFPKQIQEIGTSNHNLITANQLNGAAVVLLGAASVASNNMA